MSDGFGGAPPIRLFLAFQNVDPGFSRMQEHLYRTRASIFLVVFEIFRLFQWEGNDFLPTRTVIL
jgi:hypothetical protein